MSKPVSLSTIKRQTRAANLALGTNYSPTEIYRRQLFRWERGLSDSYDYGIIKQFKGVRADVNSSLQDVGGKNSAVINQFFWDIQGNLQPSKLIAKYAELKEGDYFGTNTAYKVRNGVITKIDKYGNETIVKSVPKSAKPFTAQERYRRAKEYIDRMHQANKARPGTGYDEKAIENVLKDMGEETEE